MLKNPNHTVQIDSEIGRLRRLLIHSPDSGIGKVVPSKAQDWLFEDIVHLETIRKKEYDYYIKLLLYFLDAEKIKGKLKAIDTDKSRDFYKPNDAGFYHSDKVIEFEKLLSEILENESVKKTLVASVCALEGCTHQQQTYLEELPPIILSQILISGMMDEEQIIFPPIPNLIFTRDIGIIINDHILLNKPAKKARSRESLLARYIFFNHSFFQNYKDKIIEITYNQQNFLLPDDEQVEKNTLEGGDVMMVSAKHVLIGHSERTSMGGINETIKALFAKNVVEKVTVVRIPHKRDFMHIDTVFTQVKKNMWVLLDSVGRRAPRQKPEPMDSLLEDRSQETTAVIQFIKEDIENPVKFPSIEDLLADISKNDLGCSEETVFIYSGDGKFPYASREQWTDSCNVLALKEGVVVGYDRNEHTIKAFRKQGFKIIPVKSLLQKFEADELTPDELENTFITMPSAELSRARGGFHCMSMPILRDRI